MGYLEFKALLEKYRNQQCNSEELKRLWDHLTDERKEKMAEAILSEDLNNFSPNESDVEKINFEGIYKSLEAKIVNQKLHEEPKIQKSKGIWVFTRVAAVFLVSFLAGSIFTHNWDGRQGQNIDVTYCEIKAPLGGKSEVTLPDGSHVWLNAGSKIKYLNQFNKNNRNISLEGEAYFKVAKNTKLPFIVKAGDLNIIAVGTEFNVKSYKDEGIIETTLVEGKVTIRNDHQTIQSQKLFYLVPAQKAVYIRDQKDLKVEDMNSIKKSNPEIIEPQKGAVYVAEKIDPVPIVAWKDNRLIFKSEEICNLAVKLGRKYNVIISFASENIKQYRFSGTLEDETLTQVLDVIKLTAPIDYTLDGKEVKIFENTKMAEKFSNHLKRK
jgi:ferric-dicitrate binding protein FerR (iron transport regulator)